MNPFEKAVRTLEFDKVLSLLAACCSVEAGKEKILTLRPERDRERVLYLQKQTSAAKTLLAQKGAPHLSAHPTLPDLLDRAEKGAALNPGELLRFQSLLHSVEQAISYGAALEKGAGTLGEIFNRLLPNRSLEKELSRCLLSEETIADDATPALFAIRRKKIALSERIRESLQHYISGAFGHYLQENIITFRNSRYVIPVKSEYKNEIKGLIHDTSASGATVFIEPMPIVEWNNEIKVLEGQERDEIEKILFSLSGQVAAFSDAFRLDFYNVVELSIVFARAELSYKMDAAEPQIMPRCELCLEKARHPLLDRKTAVPISVSLGRDFDTLVITGPNTGGKTVSLKTIGLLSMMAQTGLHLPAETAQMPVFHDILADIGDEQSIEQSLSTFSSHMVNIVEMLASAQKDVLMLFDELGSGTDPIEGAALAEAILESVREKGVKSVATTHYAELKSYALESERVENASCEFDIATLRPTYRLITGTPGRSNAFLISERIGLSPEILQKAKIKVSAEDRRFESVVEKLENERVSMEKMRREAEKLQAEAQKMQAEALQEREGLLANAEKELERAKKEALRLVKSARALSEDTFEKLEDLQRRAEKQRDRQVLEEERRKMRLALGAMEKDISSRIVETEENNDSYHLPRPLRVGDRVFVPSVNQEGILEKLSGREAVVLLGNLRMKIDPASLRLITELKKKTGGKKSGSVSSTPRAQIQSSLDVRGFNTEDAWFQIDKYLDDVILSGLGSVTIIHGKGTGALKTGLWRIFKKDPRIKSFRLGLWGEGDGGVTVLEMK